MEINHPVLTGVEASQWDNYSIREKNIQSKILMSWAAYAIFEQLKNLKCFNRYTKINIFCGKGNNGGDGYALAHLLSASYTQKINIFSVETVVTEDAKYFFKLCQKQNIEFKEINDIKVSLLDSSIIVDAIYGTGFRGNLKTEIQTLFKKINKVKKKTTISIDIASGCISDGTIFSHKAIKADYTFSLASYKICHLINPGIHFHGKVKVLPIGLAKDFSLPSRVVLKKKKLHSIRNAKSNKYKSGQIFIFGGSTSMEGAAVMTAYAFLKTGGGLAKVFSLSNLAKKTIAYKPEIMYYHNSNLLTLEKEYLSSIIGAKYTPTVVIGPGLSDVLSASFWQNLVALKNLNVILDGGALKQITKHKNIIVTHKFSSLILTPHEGELKYFALKQNNNLRLDTISVSQTFKATVYLKGYGGLIVYPNDKEVYPLLKNFELATGGSGDVLCGIIASCIQRQVLQNKKPEKSIEVALNFMKRKRYATQRDFFTPMDLIS